MGIYFRMHGYFSDVIAQCLIDYIRSYNMTCNEYLENCFDVIFEQKGISDFINISTEIIVLT